MQNLALWFPARHTLLTLNTDGNQTTYNACPHDDEEDCLGHPPRPQYRCFLLLMHRGEPDLRTLYASTSSFCFELEIALKLSWIHNPVEAPWARRVRLRRALP